MSSPDQGAEPGDELLERERLDHVVVGAGLERGDPGRDRVPRGQHQDRGHARAVAQRGEDLEPVAVGQAEVEDHRVGGRGREVGDGLASAREVLDLEALLAQAELEGLGESLGVLDDQDLHGVFESGRFGQDSRKVAATDRPGVDQQVVGVAFNGVGGQGRGRRTFDGDPVDQREPRPVAGTQRDPGRLSSCPARAGGGRRRRAAGIARTARPRSRRGCRSPSGRTTRRRRARRSPAVASSTLASIASPISSWPAPNTRITTASTKQ